MMKKVQETLIKKFAGQPIALFATAVFFTTSLVIGYRYGMQPVLAKRKREQAEVFADYLFNEQSKKRERIDS